MIDGGVIGGMDLQGIQPAPVEDLPGALLRRGKVSRVRGIRGRMLWDGPFPDRMEVHF